MDTKNENCGDNCEKSEKVGHLMTPSSTNSENPAGCGVNDLDKITITVAPTTGGTFDISVQKNIAIESLKKVISKKLKVPKERILLLHKERQLREGSLSQNSVCDGSTLTLLPSVETGLLSQRPEQTVMQALESLNDSQVNDFLSGKAPLNLTMRLGDHMMLIQLQLSSATPGSSRKSSHKVQDTTAQVPVPSTSAAAAQSPSVLADSADISLPNLSLINSKLNSLLHKNSENLNALKRKLTNDPEDGKKKVKSESEKDCTEAEPESPKKSSKYSEIMKDSVTAPVPPPSPASPGSSPTSSKRSEILSQIMENVRRISESTQKMTQAISGNKVCEGGGTSNCEQTACLSCGRTESNAAIDGTTDASTETDAPAALDTRALAEASRNLTQTLKQLSSEVLTCRPEQDASTSGSSQTSRRRPGTPGAIIESMQHHGKGVFSGTFSGTLNPALQDRYGRPKRDISTIIHILNDLLCATPHYRPRQSSSSKTSPSAATKIIEVTGADEEVDATGENEATRFKLERLRMIMERNRARRRARREGKVPWSASDPSAEMEAADDLESTEGGDIIEISPPEPVPA